MRQFWIITILVLSACSTLIGQENSLFWEISKKKHHTSYLYGTIHVMDERVFNFGESVLPSLYKCKAYAGEIIIEPKDMFAIIPYLIEKDKEKQCKNLLSEEEYLLLESTIEEKMGKEMLVLLPLMSPYVVAILLASPQELGDEKKGVFLDIYFQEKADSLHKKLISLESIKSQMAYIQNIDGQAQKEHLLRALADESGEEDYEELLKYYLDENLNVLLEMIEEAGNEDPLITDDFLIGRNRIQKDGIVAAMKDQSTFVAVGAAHLPGEDGIISLLRKEGFMVKAIPNRGIE